MKILIAAIVLTLCSCTETPTYEVEITYMDGSKSIERFVYNGYGLLLRPKNGCISAVNQTICGVRSRRIIGRAKPIK